MKEKYNTQKQHSRLNDARVLAFLQERGKTYSEIMNEFNFSNAGLIKILNRLRERKLIKKTKQGKSVIYSVELSGVSSLFGNYLEYLIIDLFDRQYNYWHDSSVITWIKAVDRFSSPDWIKEGINAHILYSNKFDDEYREIYPNIPEMLKGALDSYQAYLKTLVNGQVITIPESDSGNNKIVIALEFDLDKIAKAVNGRKNKDVVK